MYEQINQVLEVREEVANRLLALNWKLLQLEEVPVFNTEAGIIHSKTQQINRETVYIMGKPIKVEGFIKEDYNNVYRYLSRKEEELGAKKNE